MKSFYFEEATPLIEFFEQHKNSIIGHTLEELITDNWPVKAQRVLSDTPVILKLDNCILVVTYFFPSSVEIRVCIKEELENDMNIVGLLHREPHHFDRCDIKKQEIQGRIITDISVERFSDAFECNPDGDMRPAGGDYFSTIRLFLHKGKTLCLRGADSIIDGYSEMWCE